MKTQACAWIVLLFVTAALAAKPDRQPVDKGGLATRKIDLLAREHLRLWKVLQEVVRDTNMFGRRPSPADRLVLRGTLMRTPDGMMMHPKDRRLIQQYAWSLHARLDDDVCVVPLLGIAGNDKHMELGDQLAGKEVILTGSTVVGVRLRRLVEDEHYLAVRVESLRPHRQ
jgi:hypothetical protein